ncbi:MAG: serine protein kinase RIO [Candidatus Verstraetearchaeota archaeon]|nr:serine protein kinase RIO [Candidatus Verstraetearchaeota archaeon]
MGEDYDAIARREELRVDRIRSKRTKDEDLFKTVEEVFDVKTVMALYQMINNGPIDRVFGAVKAGKESRVYWAKGKSGEDLAVKIYLTSSMEFKKSIRQYIQGDPRFKDSRDYRKLIYTWAQKEFKNLSQAYGAGVRVPRPIHVSQNILVMEFIGKGGEPAPTLKNIGDDEISSQIYDDVMGLLDRLYRDAGLVHADLSEYNVMVHEGRAYLIDLGQAVLKTHPMADVFLSRDVANLIRFFEKKGLNPPDPESVIKWLKRQ